MSMSTCTHKRARTRTRTCSCTCMGTHTCTLIMPNLRSAACVSMRGHDVQLQALGVGWQRATSLQPPYMCIPQPRFAKDTSGCSIRSCGVSWLTSCRLGRGRPCALGCDKRGLSLKLRRGNNLAIIMNQHQRASWVSLERGVSSQFVQHVSQVVSHSDMHRELMEHPGCPTLLATHSCTNACTKRGHKQVQKEDLARTISAGTAAPSSAFQAQQQQQQHHTHTQTKTGIHRQTGRQAGACTTSRPSQYGRSTGSVGLCRSARCSSRRAVSKAE